MTSECHYPKTTSKCYDTWKRMKTIEEDVRKANIIYHSALSESYDEQPHFRPENVERVDKLLQRFAEEAGNELFLDIACGTGFMLGIAKKYFDRCIGVDNCEDMLKKAEQKFSEEISEGTITLRLADASDIPEDDETFDACSVYGSLHHFFELEPALKEAYRLLKEGGIFYADQDPNFYFFKDINAISASNLIPSDYSDIMLREISAVTGVAKKYEEELGLDIETTFLAEFQRFIKGGMKKEVVEDLLRNVGFSQVNVTYRWFLGEGYVFHQLSPELAESIDAYLRKCLPLSKYLFKYFYIVAVK